MPAIPTVPRDAPAALATGGSCDAGPGLAPGPCSPTRRDGQDRRPRPQVPVTSGLLRPGSRRPRSSITRLEPVRRASMPPGRPARGRNGGGRPGLPRPRPARLLRGRRRPGIKVKHWFPVLFDDVESTAPLPPGLPPRPDHPACRGIVRSARSRIGLGPDLWSTEPWPRSGPARGPSRRPGIDRAPGDRRPHGARADSPRAWSSPPPGRTMLAGAVALAAGRFQPLIRLDYLPAVRATSSTMSRSASNSPRGRGDRLAPASPIRDQLGDGCDFLTLAGRLAPIATATRKRARSTPRVDRRPPAGLARTPDERWAYRPGGCWATPADSAYRAMCSLFLQPDEATLMFNGYDEASPRVGRTYADPGPGAPRGSPAAMPTSQPSLGLDVPWLEPRRLARGVRPVEPLPA